MRRLSKREVCLITAIAGIVLLLLLEIFGLERIFGLDGGEKLCELLEMALTRAIGGVIFLVMLINLDYKVLSPLKAPFFGNLLFCLPPLLVAVNNFPFSAVIKGEAGVYDSPQTVLLLLLECICVGFFEETAFRGVVFLGILRRKKHSRAWAFVSILLSSAVFGIVHIVNIFQGASPIAVLMQVLRQIGYSSLIGAMCAVMLLKTQNIWLPVAVHGIFNFCGAVVPNYGVGEWDTFTVILTIVLSLAVTAYMTAAFLKLDMGCTDEIYNGKNNKNI